MSDAGYLILQVSDDAELSNDYRRRIGTYRGVDRLPPFLYPDDTVRLALNAPLVDDPQIRAALETWFEIHTDATPFLKSFSDAARVLGSMEPVGIRLEIVYCQIAGTDEDDDRRQSHAGSCEGSALVTSFYGFDVSWPSCNHSAILQPGVVPESAEWRSQLNEFGLLGCYSDAVALRDEYVRAYPYPPFEIFLVYQVATSD
ncbi:MAG TPA: hypothetical protein VGJ26_20785 [Pirellulales bacterium]